jgi:hypothetical protein
MWQPAQPAIQSEDIFGFVIMVSPEKPGLRG